MEINPCHMAFPLRFRTPNECDEQNEANAMFIIFKLPSIMDISVGKAVIRTTLAGPVIPRVLKPSSVLILQHDIGLRVQDQYVRHQMGSHQRWSIKCIYQVQSFRQRWNWRQANRSLIEFGCLTPRC